MGKKSKTPAAPDYSKLAEQTAASKQAATAQQTLENRANQIGPGGESLTWSQDPTTKQWTQTTKLGDQQQQALNQQYALQNQMNTMAGGMMGRVQDSFSQPFNWGAVRQGGQSMMGGNLSAGPELTRGPDVRAGYLDAGGDLGRQRIEQALLDRMRPENQLQQQALEAQLMNQGLRRGTPQFQRALQQLGDQQSRQRFDALNQGGVEQQRQFGMMQQAGAQNFDQQARASDLNFNQNRNMLADNFARQAQAGSQNFNQGLQANNYNQGLRQSDIQEQMMRRNMPLNELNALLQGQQVSNPQFQSYNAASNAGGTDYMGAGQQQMQAATNASNAQQGKKNSTMSGVGSLAGAAAMAF